jgi:hypothetical protein
MNVYVLRIENSVEGVFKSIDEVFKIVEEFVNEDFDWELFKNNLKIDYDFGGGVKEEMEIYSFII